jgi:hypothetical protein
MLFQSLDDKKQCVGYYVDGSLVYTRPPSLTKTWSYSAHLPDLDIEYASLYCNGKSLKEVCPEHLKEEWARITNKLRAFFRSFGEARLSSDDNCFFDLVPDRFLLEFCDLKNQITEHVFQSYKKPQNYDFLLSLTKLVGEIKYQKLNVSVSALKPEMAEEKTRNFVRKVSRIEHSCKYNTFGTKTGRMTTQKNSFPILTMDKNYRKILSPVNDWFVELDFNAAELRTLLALLDKQQPQEDMHEWNLKNVYRGMGTRENAKKRIFAWLYNQESQDHLANKTYDRELIKKKYWNGSHIINPFGRLIESDEFHAVNYLVQSTASDIFLRQAIKVHDLLKTKKSFISFMIHDSLVIDFCEEERNLILPIVQNFSRTNFGDFLTTVEVGKNFGEMKGLKWNTTS